MKTKDIHIQRGEIGIEIKNDILKIGIGKADNLDEVTGEIHKHYLNDLIAALKEAQRKLNTKVYKKYK